MSTAAILDNKIKLALEALAAKPSEANYAVLARCYLDAAGFAAAKKDWRLFFDCLQCVERMSLRSKYYNRLLVDKVVAICVKCRNVVQESEVVDSLFDLVANLDYDGDEGLRYRLFGAFHWYSKYWRGYLDFCDWWGFNNFKAEDFSIKNKRDSLVESAYIAYSRRLSAIAMSEFMFDFYVSFIDKMLDHVFTVYADYHVATFMLRVGFDSKDILRAFRRYIKQKYHKPWSWIALSHTFEEDSVEYQACVMFAKECEGVWVPSDMDEMDYRKICHNMFVRVADPDNDFWMHVRDSLLEAKACGKWIERKKHLKK